VLLLAKKEEKPEEKILIQICLKCGEENKAGEVVCRKCGQPLGTPQLSRKRKVLEIVAVFVIFTVVLLLVLLVSYYYFWRYRL